MYKLIILGSGAAPGVPAIANGWGCCDSNNYKNKRSRTSTYIEYNEDIKILIDTSPDLRTQLLTNHIRQLDGVLYTHPHADHLHGIDDLREINRASHSSLNFYGSEKTVVTISQRFPYLIARPDQSNDSRNKPSLMANIVEPYQPFYIGNLKITPINLIGHNSPSTGYIFNDGEIVYIADYRSIDEAAFQYITRSVKLMVVPLTTPYQNEFHAGITDILADIRKINPEKTIINHMASECDYEEIMNLTPENVEPAYDNMMIEIK